MMITENTTKLYSKFIIQNAKKSIAIIIQYFFVNFLSSKLTKARNEKGT